MSRSEHPTVVLVNDDPVLMRYWTILLEDLGYQVAAIIGPRRALNEIPSLPESIDLMLVDGRMPEMDGPDFLAELKMKFPVFFSNTRIVGFSSFPPDSRIAKDFKAAGVEFRQKPEEPSEFPEIVESLLGSPPGVTSSSSASSQTGM